MSDKIEEIRDRVEQDVAKGPANKEVYRVHKDRAFLLAEVDRLRAEIERLFNEDTKTRHALKGWVFACPDGGDEPTHERVAAVVAEVERLRAQMQEIRERLYLAAGHAAAAALLSEEAHRKALEGKP